MKQTIDGDFEILITDDGTTNQAKEFVNTSFPKAIWLEGPKRGPAANRNSAAKYASGEWLIFLDDDCLPSEFIIANYLDAIQNNQAVLVFEGKTITPRPFKHSMETAPINLEGGNLWSCNFCINKRFFLSLNGFDETYLYPHLEDNDLANRIKKITTPVFVPLAFVEHPPRMFPNGVRLGKYHQFDIYYYRKFNIPYSFYSIVRNIFITRTTLILQRPFTRYTFISLRNLSQEIFITLLNFNRWEKSFTGKSLSTN